MDTNYLENILYRKNETFLIPKSYDDEGKVLCVQCTHCASWYV